MKIPKILIVDDLKAAHQLYKQALKGENFEIYDAEKGAEAITIVLSKDINLILLDINLPDMSGLEVLEEIRKKREFLPVIITTSHAIKEIVVKAATKGIDSYLVKPIDLQLLRERIKTILHLTNENSITKITKQSRDLLKEIANMNVDESISDNVNELKLQIKELANKLQNIEKEQIQKSKLEEVIWRKEVSCPVCASNFISYNFKTKALPVIQKESDFHEIYEITNPMVFDMWVCPECLYSGRKDDFIIYDINIIEKLAKDKPLRKKLAGNQDFRQIRNYDTGLLSYKLAINCYETRGINHANLGSLYLRMAWLSREKQLFEDEKKYMKMVIELYEKAIENKEKIVGQLSELGIKYLLGELSRRIGDYSKAMQYFMKIKQDPNAREDKGILKMTSEQIDVIKAERK